MCWLLKAFWSIVLLLAIILRLMVIQNGLSWTWTLHSDGFQGLILSPRASAAYRRLCCWIVLTRRRECLKKYVWMGTKYYCQRSCRYILRCSTYKDSCLKNVPHLFLLIWDHLFYDFFRQSKMSSGHIFNKVMKSYSLFLRACCWRTTDSVCGCSLSSCFVLGFHLGRGEKGDRAGEG